MTQCRYCGSRELDWFTPEVERHQGAIFVCRRCERVTIRTRRAAWRPIAAPARPEIAA
jgi:hypothetical protein